MHARLWLPVTTLGAVAAAPLALAQHRQDGPERPERWRGPNVTTVNTQRYVETTTYPTYYPILPMTMSDGTVRQGGDPVVAPPGPAKPADAPTAPVPVGPTPPSRAEKPPVMLVEPAQAEATAVWANFWEANRARVLATLRDHRPGHAPLASPLWQDRTVQALLQCLADRDPTVSGFAAAALGSTGRPEFFSLLTQACEPRRDGDDHIARSGAILGLGLCREPRATQQLNAITAAFNPDQQPRDRDGDGKPDPATYHEVSAAQWRAAFALAATGLATDPAQVEFLRDLMRRPDLPPVMRTSAALGLSALPVAEAARALVDAVLEPDLPHEVRGIALLSVGRGATDSLPGPFVKPPRRAEFLLDVLRTFARDSRSLRLGAAMGLWHCAAAADLPAVREAIAVEDDTQTRGALLVALAWRSRGVPEAAASALRVLRQNTAIEQRPAVRGFALLGLGLLGAPDGAAICRARLSDDPSPDVRAAAAVALALVDGPAALESLVQALVDMRRAGDVVNAAYVLEALGLVGGDEARGMLRKRFAEAAGPHERRAAGLALALLQDASIVDALLADLASDAQWTPAGAALALAQYTDAAVRDRVRPLATDPRRPASQRELAVGVLARWVQADDRGLVADWAADGVVFPRDGGHILFDLQNWP